MTPNENMERMNKFIVREGSGGEDEFVVCGVATLVTGGRECNLGLAQSCECVVCCCV